MKPVASTLTCHIAIIIVIQVNYKLYTFRYHVLPPLATSDVVTTFNNCCVALLTLFVI